MVHFLWGTWVFWGEENTDRKYKYKSALILEYLHFGHKTRGGGGKIFPEAVTGEVRVTFQTQEVEGP